MNSQKEKVTAHIHNPLTLRVLVIIKSLTEDVQRSQICCVMFVPSLLSDTDERIEYNYSHDLRWSYWPKADNCHNL